MNLRDEILQYANDEKNQPVSIQEIAQYARTLHLRDIGPMVQLLADIREAALDPLGLFTRDQLVERIADTFARANLSDLELLEDGEASPDYVAGWNDCVAAVRMRVWPSTNLRRSAESENG
jgi:hypothetical protein